MPQIKKKKEYTEMLFYNQEGLCAICGLEMILVRPNSKGQISSTGATIDHKLPKKLGGTNKLSNLQIVHRYCNNKRGHKEITELDLEHICNKMKRRIEHYNMIYANEPNPLQKLKKTKQHGTKI